MILHILQMDDGETREEAPMNVMILQQAEREARRVQANLSFKIIHGVFVS